MTVTPWALGLAWIVMGPVNEVMGVMVGARLAEIPGYAKDEAISAPMSGGGQMQYCKRGGSRRHRHMSYGIRNNPAF